jgi:hypothetical protein
MLGIWFRYCYKEHFLSPPAAEMETETAAMILRRFAKLLNTIA